MEDREAVVGDDTPGRAKAQVRIAVVERGAAIEDERSGKAMLGSSEQRLAKGPMEERAVVTGDDGPETVNVPVHIAAVDRRPHMAAGELMPPSPPRSKVPEGQPQQCWREAGKAMSPRWVVPGGP